MAERPHSAAEAPPDPLPTPPEGYDPITEEVLSALPDALGMRLTVWREGYAEMEGDITETIGNRHGYVHGGALATLIDTAAGYAAVYCPYPGRRRNAFTLALNLQFIAAAAREDGPLRASARRVGGGASVSFIEAEVHDRHGKLIANSSGVFKLLGASRSLWGIPR